MAVSQPAAARQSRGHVTPACAGRVFKARVAQIGTIAPTTKRTTTTKRAPMDKMRKTALVAGVFYLITFVSIPTLSLYGP